MQSRKLALLGSIAALGAVAVPVTQAAAAPRHADVHRVSHVDRSKHDRSKDRNHKQDRSKDRNHNEKRSADRNSPDRSGTNSPDHNSRDHNSPDRSNG